MDLEKSNQKTPVGWWWQLRRRRTLLLALGVVAATSVSAHALDLCMDFSGGGSVVLKRFKVPGRNKCAPMQGFENVQYGGTVMSGMGCTNVAGDWLTFHYTSHNRHYPSYFESAGCYVQLPVSPVGSSGTCYGTWILSPGDHTNNFGQDITLRYCNVDVNLRP
jgi:hypothetical protein